MCLTILGLSLPAGWFWRWVGSFYFIFMMLINEEVHMGIQKPPYSNIVRKRKENLRVTSLRLAAGRVTVLCP